MAIFPAIRRREAGGIYVPKGSAEPPALVAAAERVTGLNANKLQRLIQPWQQDAFRFYATLGEIWYASQFYARALSKLRIYVGEKDAQGEVTEIEDLNNPAIGLLDRVQDPGGGRSQLLGAYGRLMFLTGEGYLTVTAGVGGEEQWEFLSCNELRVQSDNRYLRVRAPSMNPEELWSIEDDAFEPLPGDGKKTAVVYRMWRKSPEFSYLADSPLRAVLDLCDELLLLQLSVRARAKSRIAGAGLLLVSADLSFPSPDGANDEDPKVDPFQQRLQEVMSAAIRDPGSAAQVVPPVIRVPTEMIKDGSAVRHIQLHDPTQTYPEEGLRSEIIRRIATGLDLPPEILLGMSDANHWTAWQIDDQTWTAHLQPVAQQLVDDFTSAYLRPAAREAGIQGWESLVVGYDAAEVVNHPDRLKDSVDLWDRGTISSAKLREAAGFNDDDKPTEEEHQEWLAIKLRDPLLIEGDGAEATPEEDDASEVIDEPPSEELLEDEDSPNVNAAAVVGAAELAFQRARELAGSRLRTRSNGHQDCRTDIDGLNNRLVASALGAERAEKIGSPNARALVAGAGEAFSDVAVSFGVPEPGARRLATMIEEHAARSLFDANPGLLPPSFRAYVERLL